MDPINRGQTKEKLRAEYLEKRRSLPTSEWELANVQIGAQIRTLNLSGIKTLHIFLPIQKFGEPDTFRFVRALEEEASQPLRWVISRTDIKNGELYHFIWDQSTVIRENRWGIPEPLGGVQVREDEIDLVFIPLLIFDHNGHRVGYGKGFYDRFLARCNARTRKIGISLFEPVTEILDIYDSDIPLDACVTPQSIYWFPAR